VEFGVWSVEVFKIPLFGGVAAIADGVVKETKKALTTPPPLGGTPPKRGICSRLSIISPFLLDIIIR
jgi:hypothetical protein